MLRLRQRNPLPEVGFRFEEEKAKAEFTPGLTIKVGMASFTGALALCLDEAFGYVLYSRGLRA